MPERYLGRSLGRYRVEALLGTGGFAWVYRAHDPDLDIPVALKVLKPQYAGDPAFVERFRREASTAARLRHPNVITIYNVGQEGDAVYFAMDYLPQGLSSRLEVTPTIPGPALVRIALDVAGALGFAHRQGVVHRDIKPDNILFDEHGNAVVADFGIARALTSNTRQTATQMVVGTPHYFAPEQARGAPLDGRADLYALGVTLYRAATGALPFPGEDWYEVACAHLEQEPADVRRSGAAISAELAAIIHRLLEKDPADRFQDAEALAAALTATPEHGGASNGATSARTVAIPALDRLWTTTGMTARRRRLRQRVLVGSAAGAALLLAIAALWMVRNGANDSARTDPGSLAAADSTLLTPTLPAIRAAAPLPDDGTRPPPTPPRQRATIHATAPDGATISLDGHVVGEGSWSSDTIGPGAHVLAALVATLPGCATALVEQRVSAAAGSVTRVPLSPRPCGRLAIVPRVGSAELAPEAGGRYTLVDAEGESRSGDLPLGGPLLLPAGRYDLKVGSIALCSQFSGTVDVAAGETVTPRILLLCEPG